LKTHVCVHHDEVLYDIINSNNTEIVPNIREENQNILDHVQFEHDNLSNEGIVEIVPNNDEENPPELQYFSG
jgi:hypothetical protein